MCPDCHDSQEERCESGADAIAAERQRQIEIEGWTQGHDAQHDDESLAAAAICYLEWPNDAARQRWPWDLEWFKPKNRYRNLVRAGALIAAEIDRLYCHDAQGEPVPYCSGCRGITVCHTCGRSPDANATPTQDGMAKRIADATSDLEGMHDGSREFEDAVETFRRAADKIEWQERLLQTKTDQLTRKTKIIKKAEGRCEELRRALKRADQLRDVVNVYCEEARITDRSTVSMCKAMDRYETARALASSERGEGEA
jgi:predicted RNase H-like nuclease (RuvC/YqgF family)